MSTKFKQWLDTAITSGGTQNVYDQSTFNSNTQRTEGYKSGDTLSSLLMNSILRQTSLICVALMDQFCASSTVDLASNLADVKLALSSGIATVQSVNDLSANILDGTVTVKKAECDESGNNIKATYGTSLGGSGATVTLLNKEGNSISSRTINNVSHATTATTATKATQDESGNNIKATYAVSLTGSDTDTLTLKNNKSETLSTVTINNVAKAVNADKIKTSTNAYTTIQQVLLDMVYPVGSIYMSVNNVSPATFLGGSWERYSKGTVLVGIDENDSDFAYDAHGGEKTHKLTISEMPSHTHTVTARELSTNTPVGIVAGTRAAEGGDRDNIRTSGEGSGVAHNNLQPYITCYMWKRTL